MLILSRHEGDSIQIGPDITITFIDCPVNIKVGIEAPRDVQVLRDDAKKQEPK